ncbi:hypothetical protein [Escherichia phage ZCEC13]|uniref:YspA cpYpsA-related SLOG domain-containing protein n=2 Tax=Escherichia phage ZCEC13 TaxID=2935866 RepID=A0AAE9KRN4_9CAUD|nr:hypothetical protein [Escherichia phage ZCEC13]
MVHSGSGKVSSAVVGGHKMKVLITGGRGYSDFDAFEKAMEMLPFKIELIIHGGARGADSIADMWAKKHGVFVMRMDALWNAHGKGAGPKRNWAMLNFGKPDYCVAFPGGNGTADMVRQCEKASVVVWKPYG